MPRLCPYCETVELVAAEEGGLPQCPVCMRSALPEDWGDGKAQGSPFLSSGTPDPAGKSNAAGAFGPGPKRGNRTRRGSPGETPSLPAAVAGLVATLVFYGLLVLMPKGRISELFLERGWVPYVITGISAWALFILAAKVLRMRKERALLNRDWLSTPLTQQVDPQRAGQIVADLEQSPEDLLGSFVGRRVERLLRHFETRRSVSEAVEFLNTESQADEVRVDASYGLVRVFVWAVPTLGFIGTVIGIGGAVAGFSETLEAASSIDGMKDSIGSVTGGLGIAFDTTLLALVMSILIMFPSSAVQRLEETLLTEIDDYCTERILRRLAEEPTAAIDSQLINALAERLVAAMKSVPRLG